jgi:hypothetical protein
LNILARGAAILKGLKHASDIYDYLRENLPESNYECNFPDLQIK